MKNILKIIDNEKIGDVKMGFDIIIKVGFAVIVFLFGLMLWISGDFANVLGISGWGRFIGGLISMGVGALIGYFGRG